MINHLQLLASPSEHSSLPRLHRIVVLGDSESESNSIAPIQTYNAFVSSAGDCGHSELFENVKPSDILSLQFTSGEISPEAIAR